MIDFLGTYLPEFFYVLCGLVSFDTAYRATKNEEARIGTSLFWFLLGVIFTFGKIIPSVGVGVLLVLMGCLTVLKQVKMCSFVESTPEFRKKASERVGNKIFIPAVPKATPAAKIPVFFQLIHSKHFNIIILLLSVLITGIKSHKQANS